MHSQTNPVARYPSHVKQPSTRGTNGRGEEKEKKENDFSAERPEAITTSNNAFDNKYKEAKVRERMEDVRLKWTGGRERRNKKSYSLERGLK